MKRSMVLAAAAIILTACVHSRITPTVSDELTLADRQSRLAALGSWQMRGRLAIDTGERAYQARFIWRQDDNALDLTVRGLLGAGSFQIQGTSSALTVTARGDSRLLTDPELELSSMFGWWLPVNSLGDWLLGLPDLAYPLRSARNADDVLLGIEQRDWQIDYTEYQLSAGLLVPKRMQLKSGPLELLLNVDSWDPLSPPNGSLN